MAEPSKVEASAGLTQAQAQELLSQNGPNAITRQGPPSPLRLLLRQFNSPLVWLLLGAAAFSGWLSDFTDAAAIAAIIVLNSAVGFFQEFRAERALAALRMITAPRARVIRDGKQHMVPAAEVVVGDVLALEAGDIIAADAGLLEAHELSTNEAALTGESMPVEKSAAAAPTDAPLSDRTDSVFMGTSVAAGSALARVESTGMQTELGKIAHLLTTAREGETPLQRRLAKLNRTLLWVCLVIVAVVTVEGMLQRESWAEVMLISISLAVAAVPEGLPAVVTIALALGVRRMAKRHVLVRKLASVETLGCATVICTDKTGTLTTGIMAVRELWGPDEKALLYAAAACCDAELKSKAAAGDPMEIAILEAAQQRGIQRHEIEQSRPRVKVRPFDSARKRMSVLRKDGVLYVKGATEALSTLAKQHLAQIAEANTAMAARGLRVLAVGTSSTGDESGLELLGLIGLADPPRKEVIEAVREAKEAGIRTIMITGDHPLTASAIAVELGILEKGEKAEGIVYARATAADKLKIVRELKQRGEIVAMTGDGVNDAPALKEAHIGVAMGKTGTEVTREAADLVLTDDNYASIVHAVGEGRAIYANIRKALVFVLGGNVGELLVMFGAGLLGWPVPLLPLHLLWVNLVTDGAPSLALVTDPAEPDVMKRRPRRAEAPILGARQWTYIVITGVFEALCSLAVFGWALQHQSVENARSLAFSVIIFAQMFRALSARSESLLVWETGLRSNWRLVAVTFGSIALQLAILRMGFTQELFKFGDISWENIGLCLLVGLVPVTMLEVWKLLKRIGAKQQPENGA